MGVAIACKSYSCLRLPFRYDFAPPSRLVSGPWAVLGHFSRFLQTFVEYRHAGFTYHLLDGAGGWRSDVGYCGVCKGRGRISLALHRYGATCALLMNVPFALNLYLARHVPPTELAIIITTSPFFNYLAGAGDRVGNGEPKTFAGNCRPGFLSTLVLILSREGMLSGAVSWWLIASLGMCRCFTVFYNAFAARAYPGGC